MIMTESDGERVNQIRSDQQAMSWISSTIILHMHTYSRVRSAVHTVCQGLPCRSIPLPLHELARDVRPGARHGQRSVLNAEEKASYFRSPKPAVSSKDFKTLRPSRTRGTEAAATHACVKLTVAQAKQRGERAEGCGDSVTFC